MFVDKHNKHDCSFQANISLERNKSTFFLIKTASNFLEIPIIPLSFVHLIYGQHENPIYSVVDVIKKKGELKGSPWKIPVKLPVCPQARHTSQQTNTENV